MIVDDDDGSSPDGDRAEPEPEEHAELKGPGGIAVSVRWHRGTGQYHVATELVITTPGGALRLAATSRDGVPDGDGDDEPLYPLIERILPAGSGRWVLLGWSSGGEGMQTQHAWLIEDRHGAQLVDALAWTTDRAHGGFAVEASARQVRIGVPLPQPPGPDGEPYMHRGDEWQLVHGKQQLDLEAIRRLPSTETHVMALQDYYDPPFQDEPSLLHWSGSFVWFASGAGFVLEAPAAARPPPRRR